MSRRAILGIAAAIALAVIIPTQIVVISGLMDYWRTQGIVIYLLRSSQIKADGLDCSERFLARDNSCSVPMTETEARRLAATAGLHERPITDGLNSHVADTLKADATHSGIHYFASDGAFVLPSGKGRLEELSVYVGDTAGEAVLLFR